ncbi:IS110 family transposase (plasmid) [Pseudonocardia bannensis]|uniref:Transposase n=1 Tax=Pseudonocardia bannensis TaxID=630973 RepID=A0A848DJZ3_9PSEU|nr:transposase [Pseudonocardia bannensis]NMH93018.1 transposase [Pseudonocardia bannensis]
MLPDGAGSRHVVRGPAPCRAGPGGRHDHHRYRSAQAGPHREHIGSGHSPGAGVGADRRVVGGYRQLLRWASWFESRRWAVGNARSLGRHLAQWLVVRGEQVEDVPCTATARVRESSRGGRRKNDVIDAAAAAGVAVLGGDGQPVAVEDLSTALAVLDEGCANLVAHRTRRSISCTRCCATRCPVARTPT